ncbi:MAG: InlB B-repeat-containing protein, partial [Erysipelotrichaceae bacterium]|nr:InlB B-repeat-containing protein [Erysipelotrichaceae bacterium]
DNIEKEGYAFVGWYADENFTGDPITEIDAAATGDKILYAKFEINQYTVTFKDWDGKVLKEDKVEHNTAAIAPEDPTRVGYRFIGWDKTFDAITDDTEVTAQYEKKWTVPPVPTVPLKDVEINETNFPDANFRTVVKRFDRDGDNVLSAEEIGSVTMINCNNQNIHSLKGIEYFAALRTLYCQNSQLTSLDVSKNTALRILYCDGNQLTSLDVSQNTELRELYCDGNQLTSLDVSKNTALWRLHCNTNQLTSLELGKNTKLLYLYCYDNQLTSLDVSQNTSLIALYCHNNQLMSLDLANNPKITSFKGEDQTIELGEISKDQYDLNIKDPNIDSN